MKRRALGRQHRAPVLDPRIGPVEGLHLDGSPEPTAAAAPRRPRPGSPARAPAPRAPPAKTRSHPRRRTPPAAPRAEALVSLAATQSTGDSRPAARGPIARVDPTASAVGRPPPTPPPTPISSPAHTTGTPGKVIWSPTPTSCRSRDPATVRNRAESQLSSSDQECSTALHDIPARNARIVASIARPSSRGSPPGESAPAGGPSPRSHCHTGRVKPA